MALQFFYEGLEFVLNSFFRGITPPSSTAFRIALLNNATITAASTMADVLKQEIRSTDGYTRGNYLPSAAAIDLTIPGVKFPAYTHTFTAAGVAPLVFDCFVIIANGKSKANALISSIASDTLTSTDHGFVAGDRVYFDSSTSYPSGIEADEPYYVISSGLTTNAFKISDTEGGSAIALGTSWSGNLYAQNGSGTLVNLEYREDDGTGDRSKTIPSGQSYPLLVTLGGKRGG